MRVYTTSSISPYEIVSELLVSSLHVPFLSTSKTAHQQFQMNRIGYTCKVTRLFHPTNMGRQITMWDIMDVFPHVAKYYPDHESDDGTCVSFGTPSRPLVTYEAGNYNWSLVAKFAIHPAPERTVGELINRFLSEPIPPIEITIGGLDSSLEPNAIPLEDFQPSPPSALFPPVRMAPFGDFGSFRPLVSFPLSYRSRLEMLWKLPTDGRSPFQLVGDSSGNWAMLVRFLHPNNPSAVLIVRSTITSDVESFELRARVLFADTIAMLSALLGYTRLETNELAMLILSWWATVAGNYTRHLRRKALSQTSVLLLYDMLSRVENMELFVEMMNRIYSPKDAITTECMVVRIQHARYRLHVPVFCGSSSITHTRALELWNLIRTQLGLGKVTMDSYLEVPHAFEEDIESPHERESLRPV